ncbi:MAG: GHMP family kinase ATP-binding protein [Deferrisomatales bacterium]
MHEAYGIRRADATTSEPPVSPGGLGQFGPVATRPSGLASFEPGDPARVLGPERWGGQARPARPGPPGTSCEVEVPSRLHASVLDMNRFDVGSPGGGGIGFAVSLHCRARATLVGGRDTRIGGNRPALALHGARLFRAVTGFEGGLELELVDHTRRHMGLGSSVGALAAAALALNEILGRPFDMRNLRRLVAHNYGEEAEGEPGRLVHGFDTNVGAMAAVHGGMVVATDDCELLYRVPLPPGMRALLLVPLMPARVASGVPEAEALLGLARAMDQADAREKAYRVLMDLLPAMIRGDFAAVGDVLFDLTGLGSKRAECRLHGSEGAEIYAVLEALRAQGAEIVGMSSVGPAVFALSADPAVWERWRTWDAPHRAGCVLEVPVDNAGARVRLDGVPIPYHFEPWWSEPKPAPPATADREPDPPHPT